TSLENCPRPAALAVTHPSYPKITASRAHWIWAHCRGAATSEVFPVAASKDAASDHAGPLATSELFSAAQRSRRSRFRLRSPRESHGHGRPPLQRRRVHFRPQFSPLMSRLNDSLASFVVVPQMAWVPQIAVV